MFLIAEVQTKVINYNCAKKSCLLQVVRTKAIVALTQFCDFFLFLGSNDGLFRGLGKVQELFWVELI